MKSKLLIGALLVAVAAGCSTRKSSVAKLGFSLPSRARYTVTDQQFEKAAKTLRNALTADPNNLKSIVTDPCMCGPGLWHTIQDSPHFSVPPRAQTTCKIPLPNGATQELPAAFIQDEAEAARFRAALADLFAENGAMTFRLPTEREFKIYWATIPFDEISDPLVVAEGSRYDLLVQFAGGRPFWFDEVRQTTLK